MEYSILQSVHPYESSIGGPITTQALHLIATISVQPGAARNQLPFKPKPWVEKIGDLTLTLASDIHWPLP